MSSGAIVLAVAPGGLLVLLVLMGAEVSCSGYVSDDDTSTAAWMEAIAAGSCEISPSTLAGISSGSKVAATVGLSALSSTVLTGGLGVSFELVQVGRIPVSAASERSGVTHTEIDIDEDVVGGGSEERWFL